MHECDGAKVRKCSAKTCKGGRRRRKLKKRRQKKQKKEKKLASVALA